MALQTEPGHAGHLQHGMGPTHTEYGVTVGKPTGVTVSVGTPKIEKPKRVKVDIGKVSY